MQTQTDPATNAASGTGAPQFASLYVGDLDPEVTEAMLYEIFNTVGPVASIRVCRDSVTRKSLGYAYVNFHSTADAERVMDTLNYSNIKDRCCRIMWSHRDPNLRKTGSGNVFVKNLDKNVDNKALYDTFSLFGNILSCKVATTYDGHSKGYGFVHYETELAAKQAISKVNGMQIGEKTVFVGDFLPRDNRSPLEITHFTNIYVKNYPNEWTEEKLLEEFNKFGKITSSMIQKDKKDRAFAFINYESPDEAQNAIREMHCKDLRSEEEQKDAPWGRDEKTGEPYTEEQSKKAYSASKSGSPGKSEKEKGDEDEKMSNSDDKKSEEENENKENVQNKDDSDKKSEKDEKEGLIQPSNTSITSSKKTNGLPEDEVNHPLYLVWCSRAQTKSERENMLKAKFEKEAQTNSGLIGVNLYVKNLPDDCIDTELREMFAPFGEITSARVMLDNSSKRSKGFGFVCYKTPDEATKAVSDMHLKTIKGKPLYVGLAEKKEERTQRLAQRYKGASNSNTMGAGQGMGGPGVQGQGQMGQQGQMGGQMGGQFGNPAANGMMNNQLYGMNPMNPMGGPGAGYKGGPNMGGNPQGKGMYGANMGGNQQFGGPNLGGYGPQSQGFGGGPNQQMGGPGPKGNQANFGNLVGVNPQQQLQAAQNRGPNMGQVGGNPNMNPNANMAHMNHMNQMMAGGNPNGMMGGPGGVNGGGMKGGGYVGGHQQMPMGGKGGGPVNPNMMGKNGGNMMNQNGNMGGGKGNMNQNQNMGGANGNQIGQNGNQLQNGQNQSGGGNPGRLTSQQLAQAPPGMQKQMLGEKLYPAVSKFQPDLAGKITGMMLEMQNSEVLMILDNQAQLQQKVDEAVRVLSTMPK